MAASSSQTSKAPPFRTLRSDQMESGALSQPHQAKEMVSSLHLASHSNSSIRMCWPRTAPRPTQIRGRVFPISEIVAPNRTPIYRNSSRDCPRIFTIRGRGLSLSIPTTMPLVLTMAMRAVTPSETTCPHCLTSHTNHSTSPNQSSKQSVKV